MGLKDKLYSDGSPSKLDQPIGIQQGRDRQATDRAFQNEEHVQKKQYMLGRRMYRTAMRSNNPGAQIAAMEALGNAGLGFNAGIKQAGQTGAANRGRFESTQGQLDAFNGNGTPLQGQQRRAGESELNFAGRLQQSGDQPSSGAGLSGGGAVPGLPGIGGVLDAVDSMNGQAPTDQPSSGGPLRQGLTNPANPKREMALANLKSKFEQENSGDLANSAQRDYEARNGTPYQQREDAIAADPRPAANSSPSASSGIFTPQDKRQLRRVVGLFGPNNTNGDEAQIRGEIAAGNLINQVGNTSLSDATAVARGGAEAISSRLLSGFESARSTLGRSLEALQAPAPTTQPSPVAPVIVNQPPPPSLTGAMAKDAGLLIGRAGSALWNALTPELLPENRYGPAAQERQMTARAKALREKSESSVSSNTAQAIAKRRKFLAERLENSAKTQRGLIPTNL